MSGLQTLPAQGRYDEVVSLGQWCATSLLLKKLGLRLASGPFDWLLGQKAYLEDYTNLLKTRFVGFFAKGNLIRVGEDVAEKHVHYRDERTGFVLRHDFDLGVPFDKAYPNVHEKYARRIKRMLAALDVGRSVLFVHFRGEGHYVADELVSAVETLRICFPNAKIDLLVLEVEHGQVKPRFESVTQGVVRVVGDFYDPSRYDAVLGNEKLSLKILSKIRMKGRWRNLIRQRILSLRRKLLGCARRAREL